MFLTSHCESHALPSCPLLNHPSLFCISWLCLISFVQPFTISDISSSLFPSYPEPICRFLISCSFFHVDVRYFHRTLTLPYKLQSPLPSHLSISTPNHLSSPLFAAAPIATWCQSHQSSLFKLDTATKGFNSRHIFNQLFPLTLRVRALNINVTI